MMQILSAQANDSHLQIDPPILHSRKRRNGSLYRIKAIICNECQELRHHSHQRQWTAITPVSGNGLPSLQSAAMDCSRVQPGAGIKNESSCNS